MELRILHYFLTVARKENISAAANYLHISQPTLSRQLMDLEKELGVTLFVRGNRKITLTPEGILFRKRAEEILDLVSKTKMEFLSSSEIISGDIYIGAGETYVMQGIAKIIREIQEEYPNIRFHLFSGNADDVTERLDKGLLDFGILIEPADTTKYNTIQLRESDTWGILMRRDSDLASKDTISPKDLWNAPLISSRQALVSNEISKWIKKDYNELNIVATYNLVYNASLLVEEGVGYAFVLDKLINTNPNSNLCFRPLEPNLESKLNIVWNKHQVFSRASEIFLKKIENSFKRN